MLYVGYCRLCETGPLGLRKCGGCGAVVVLCDECDATWIDADLSAKPTLTNDPDLPCPHCEASLVGDTASWATRETVEATPWIIKELRAGTWELREGAAFAPESPRPTEGEIDPSDAPGDAGG